MFAMHTNTNITSTTGRLRRARTALWTVAANKPHGLHIHTQIHMVGVCVSCFARVISSHQLAKDSTKTHNRGGVPTYAPIAQRPLPFSSRGTRMMCGWRLLPTVTRMSATRRGGAAAVCIV